MLFPGPDGRLGINFFREPGRAFWNSHGLSRVADRKLRTTIPSSDERSRSQVVRTSVVDNIPLRGFLRSRLASSNGESPNAGMRAIL